MALSTEAIISLIGVLINLPPALLSLRKLCKWKRLEQVDAPGIKANLNVCAIIDENNTFSGKETPRT